MFFTPRDFFIFGAAFDEVSAMVIDGLSGSRTWKSGVAAWCCWEPSTRAALSITARVSLTGGLVSGLFGLW